MVFTINNKSNRDFNFKVKKSNHLTKSKKRLEFIKIPGRTGELIVDDNSRENFTLTLEGFVDARASKLKTVIDNIDTWLNGTKGYQAITFDDGTILKAVFIGEINPEEVIKNFGELTLQFSAYKEATP